MILQTVVSQLNLFTNNLCDAPCTCSRALKLRGSYYRVYEEVLLAPYGGGYAKNPDKEQLEQLPVQSSPGFLVADGLLGMFI